MLKKLMALATTTAMLGANAAAYAIGSAKTVVRNLAGASAADELKPGDGRNIQPSIPPMPPEEKAVPPRKAEPKKTRSAKAATHRGAAKPRAKAAKSAKAAKNAARHASKK